MIPASVLGFSIEHEQLVHREIFLLPFYIDTQKSNRPVKWTWEGIMERTKPLESQVYYLQLEVN